MRKSRLCVVLALAATWALVGCSDDDTPNPPKPDQNTTKLDGGTPDIMAADAPVLADLPVAPDQSSGQCEKTCTDQAKFLCVTSGSSCVECTTDAHCKNNPGALGNTCDVTNNFCVCSTNTDCANNVWGQKCDTANQLCRCDTDTECKLPLKCIGTFDVGTPVSVCEKPCTADTDCTGAATKCEKTSGKCVECLAPADCATSAGGKYCSTTNTCVECATNTDCASKDFEKVCDPTAGCVECLKAGDCTADSLGNTCDTTNQICTCAGDTDCAANNNGHKCDTTNQLCNCAGDTDCPTAKKCILPFGSSSKLCTVPCTADTDCTKDETKPACATTGTSAGLCVECAKAANCTDSQNGSACVADVCTCSTDADCKGGYPWGNKCESAAKRCGCSADTDCTGNPNGPKCYTNYKKCSCSADTDCTKAPYTKCLEPYAGALYKNCQKPATP